MNETELKKINKAGWNKLSKSNNQYSNASLPEYGPFISNEEKLKLFEDIEGKKVLELGCAAGKSLEYLANKGAEEVWGVDFSKTQIEKAKKLNIKNSNFILSSMEDNTGIPLNYFDYVLSLYSIGYSSNPIKTLKLVSTYLKEGGKFILSWTHPLFNCIEIENNRLVINYNYNDEKPKLITKGIDKVELLQYNLKISTLVNTIIETGLVIDKIIEETPILENNLGSYKSQYFDERKLGVFPTTIIIVAHKE